MCAASVKTFRMGKFDLNPRGDLWAKDENKFGQKLLSKMGWSAGKGLGKNENGVTEGIKVRMKLGHSGVGWSEKLSLGIENHEYDAVLESLNQKFKTSNEVKVENDLKGLEQRSQQFRNRLHYQKFVRGKDVRRYSESDMNSIFITRKTNVESPVNIPVKSNVDSGPAEDSAPESVPTFKSQLSMNDYFAMKLKRKSGELPKPNLLCTENTQNNEDTPLENGVPSRKRKREPKSHSKKSKRIKSDVTENANTAPEVDIPVEVKIDELIPLTKKKKSKLRGKLEQLKSCLKSKLGSNLWFREDKKEVSFNDSISYKFIENCLKEDGGEDNFAYDEMDGHNAMDCFEEETYALEEGECAAEEAVDHTIEESSNSVHSSPVEDSLVPNGQGICEELNSEESVDNETERMNEALEKPKCFELPKCDNSNYNTWLESQRIAIKMKLYKNMVKKFRKNPVLKTSNLLDVKGYGNWGL